MESVDRVPGPSRRGRLTPRILVVPETLDDVALIGEGAAEEMGQEGVRRVAGNRDCCIHRAVGGERWRRLSPGRHPPPRFRPASSSRRRGTHGLHPARRCWSRCRSTCPTFLAGVDSQSQNRVRNGAPEFSHRDERTALGKNRTMESASHRENRTVRIEDADSIPHREELLPDQSEAIVERLAAFITAVWTEPAAWHRVQGHNLSIRALPSHGAPGDICFEIRDTGDSREICRYVFQPERGAILVRSNPEIEHPFDPLREKLPTQIQGFALSIVALLDRRPNVLPSLNPASGPAAPAPPSVQKWATFAEVTRRILDHWFAPTARRWGWLKRFSFAFVGSVTFFLAWGVYISSVLDIWTTPDLADVGRLLGFVGVFGSLWFAGLTVWKDFGYGPIRLYLSGFLLPYFVWTLMAIMLARPNPGIAL